MARSAGDGDGSMDDGLTMSVSPQPGYVVVSVAGEVDMTTAPRLREQLASVISDGMHRVVVDLAEVTFMSSAGTAVLMATHTVLAAHGGSLLLASPSTPTWQLLSLQGLDQVIPVTHGMTDAAARWARQDAEYPQTARYRPAGPKRHRDPGPEDPDPVAQLQPGQMPSPASRLPAAGAPAAAAPVDVQSNATMTSTMIRALPNGTPKDFGSMTPR